jgi:hypothetical protein
MIDWDRGAYDTHFSDSEYRRIMDVVEYIDALERKVKSFEEAPKKLCNKECSKRQQYLIKIYERAAQVFRDMQAVHLVELKKRIGDLERKYRKRIRKLKIESSQKTWRDDPSAYM